MRPSDSLHDRCRGRWRSLLPLLGVPANFLTGKHTACPICGGKDRFRFSDAGGDGVWVCTHCCGGDGIALFMKYQGLAFVDARREIEKHIGAAPVVLPKSTRSEDARAEATKDQLQALWGRARPLDGEDIASRYLAGRGLALTVWPTCLRWIDELPYRDDNEVRYIHPAMLAKFVAHDGKSATLHRTYLSEPGTKAEVPKPRKLMPGRVPVGGAVRLGMAAETLGIAEGIETALSASIIHGIPVWSAISAGNMVKWKPPPEAKCILIFGDNDKSFAGQNSAYSLAYRLTTEGLRVEVRIPEDVGDWNDVILCNR